MKNAIGIGGSRMERLIMGLMTAWGTAVYFIGQSTLFARAPRQIFGPTILALLLALLIIFARNNSFRKVVSAIPLRYLALFHAWRIFAGLLFLAFQKELPLLFVHQVSIGDIVVGFLAIVVFVFAQNRAAYFLLNGMGLIDLAIAVSLGIYYTLSGDPRMILVRDSPLILIPLFGVPIAVFAHLLSLYRLLRKSPK